MPRLTINGEAVECAAGTSLLAAIRAAGHDVPTLCDDPRLRPIGACRLCVVDVAGRSLPVAACTTTAEDTMDVRTHTPEIERARRTLLRLLARHYPPDAAAELPEAPFHRLLRQYGLMGDLAGSPDPALVDGSHPYIQVDMSRCVTCFRCVRICDEVQGQFVWNAIDRGDATRIEAGEGGSLLGSPCVGCGACADTCPTGAIRNRTAPAHAKTSGVRWTRTVCPYCGVGCEMNVGVRDGAVVGVSSVPDAPVNRGHLCIKGRYAFEFNNAPDRVIEPMLRDARGWRPVPWDDAVAAVADGLRRVIDRHGPDAVGVLGSARATNEDNYVSQKFARVVLGTNNVDCCARVCHAPSAAGMRRALGTGAATNSFDDIEHAACILVCGANPTENHPVVGARIKQAALAGAALIVIDPRAIELARYATVHLDVRPGANIPLLNALAHVIVEDGLADADFVRDRTSGWDRFRESIREWSPERVATTTGVDAARIRAAARLYATAKPAMCFHGLGVTEHTQGTAGVSCLVNLALLTGNFGKPGAGVNPLRGQNNVQGAAHMGCDPDFLTGFAPLSSERPRFEVAWGTPLPSGPGLNLMRMMDAARNRSLRTLWAIGYDIAQTNPNARATREALSSLDVLIVQDLFLNEVAKLASVFLPAASPFERDGTFMNAERRVQRVRQALPPRGNSRPDWQILCDVARAMGKGEHFPFRSPAEIWDEIRTVWAAGRGITYDRLEHGGLQWPCPSEDHPGTPVLHVGTFAGGSRAPLQSIPFLPTAEVTADEYPFLLTTGRTLYQFNAGTMTWRTPNRTLRVADYVDVSPSDAARLGVRDGDPVRLRSRHGQAELPVRVTASVSPGQLFATFHSPASATNALTSHFRDRDVDTPEYKVIAVRIETI